MSRCRVALLCVVAGACTRPSAGREQRDFERMRVQQRYDAYETSTFFPNGAVMQPPPTHTVPRGAGRWSERIDSVGYLTGSVDGTDVADPPVQIDQATRTVGAEQFAISCAPCHGAGGYGGGPMAPNLSLKRPPSLRTAEIATRPAGTIFRIITDGLGQMPPYGWQLPIKTRWAIVAYVRSLTSLPPAPLSFSDSAMAASLHQLDSVRALRERTTAPASRADTGTR